MARIIINADDLGLSEGVNRGIVYCYQNGVVNSASLMTTTAHFENAVQLIEDHQLENIGLHFNLTEGRPALASHRTLTGDDNQFFRNVHEKSQLDLHEVYRELEAQYQIAIRAGVKVAHLDSHHHVHMTAKLRRVFVAFAKEHQLPLRKFKNASRNPLKGLSFYLDTCGTKFFTEDFSADFYGEKVTKSTLGNLLQNYTGDSLEIMCHPGFKDPENGIYNEERIKELEMLTSIKVKEMLKFISER